MNVIFSIHQIFGERVLPLLIILVAIYLTVTWKPDAPPSAIAGPPGSFHAQVPHDTGRRFPVAAIERFEGDVLDRRRVEATHVDAVTVRV